MSEHKPKKSQPLSINIGFWLALVLSVLAQIGALAMGRMEESRPNYSYVA